MLFRSANNVLCTKVLARLVVPVASYRLVHLVDYFGVDARPAHTAMGDCQMTADVFMHLRRIFDSKGATSLEALQRRVDTAPPDLRRYQ